MYCSEGSIGHRMPPTARASRRRSATGWKELDFDSDGLCSVEEHMIGKHDGTMSVWAAVSAKKGAVPRLALVAS